MQRRHSGSIACGVAALVLALGIGRATRAVGADLTPLETRYAEMLREHTRRVADVVGTRVDYRALDGDPRWQELVGELAAARPDRLQRRDEKLAFWINSYNIAAIELVRQHYPVESIRDIGHLLRPVWSREALRIGGRAYKLGEIEHEILRPMEEPRIHAAIVCASTSCPSLSREPFRASALDRQLDEAMHRFVASPGKGARIDRAEGSITLSRIFDWFEEDFEERGGVMAVVAAHLPDSDARWLLAQGDAVRIEYFDYDWSLNDVAR